MLTQLEKSMGQSEEDTLMEPYYPNWYTGEDEEWNYASRTDKKWRLVAMKCNTDVGHWFEFQTSSRGNRAGLLDRPSRREADYLEAVFDGMEIRIKSTYVVVRARKEIPMPTKLLAGNRKDHTSGHGFSLKPNG